MNDRVFLVSWVCTLIACFLLKALKCNVISLTFEVFSSVEQEDEDLECPCFFVCLVEEIVGGAVSFPFFFDGYSDT